jgi:hypothetical protein
MMHGIDMTDYLNIKVQIQELFPESNESITNSAFVGVGVDEERLAVIKNFVGKKWSQIPHEIWFAHRNALSLMPSSASSYYLPALILASIVAPELSAFAVEDLAASLNTRGAHERRAERDFAWMQFSLGQLFFIAGWLAWLGENEKFDRNEMGSALKRVLGFISEQSGYKE